MSLDTPVSSVLICSPTIYRGRVPLQQGMQGVEGHLGVIG